MDRLTKYGTQERPPGLLDQSLPQLITVLAQLPQAITTQFSQPKHNDPPDHLIEELLSSYIAMYYYTALTNFWAQCNLPNAADFDENDDLQQLTKRIVDGSSQDFVHMARILERVDQQRLAHSPLAHLLGETRDLWRHHVCPTADVFLYRTKQGS
jgi:hypothetical protein